MAWYNKYRPQEFSEVIGQELVKSVLQNALKKNRIKQAYLFYGSKGVGKTTLARIFANNLNDISTNPEAKIDLIEMDAASNTGIDDVRQLIESAKTPPISGKYKIYIIDEVHMLSKPAMNALLKILEEPPEYLVFLLATTNPEKLIPTVLSRLTKLNLSSHTIEDVVKKLKNISEKENVNIDDGSLKLIAKRSSGSLRDATNLLETVASYELDSYTIQETTQLLGLLPDELLQNLANQLLEQNITSDLVQKLNAVGIDGETFLGQFLEYLLDESFAGRTVFDSLILPTAEVLDLKLPISSIISSVALLQVKFRNFEAQPYSNNQIKQLPKTSNSEQVLELKKSDSLSTYEKKSEVGSTVVTQNSSLGETKNVYSNPPTQSSLIAEEVENNTPQKATQDETEIGKVASSKAIDETSNNTTGSAGIEEVIQKLTQFQDAPPILKMIVNDISVEKNEGDNIELSVSNSIFLAQLNSPKLNNWVKNKLAIGLRSPDLELKISLRATNNKPKVTLPEKKPIFTPQQKPVEQEPLEEKKESKKAGIFYEVYNELPENMDSSKVNVFKGPIPMPKSDKNWDDHTSELFDFE